MVPRLVRLISCLDLRPTLPAISKPKGRADIFGTVETEVTAQTFFGEKQVTIDYSIPSDQPAEEYTLEMGIVFHSSIEHTIPIANYGKTDDEWYRMGNLTVTEE